MRIENSIKNITSGLIGQIITYVLSFVVRTVFISTLGKSYLGISGLFTNVLSILSFAELGIGTAIVYNLYRPLANNDWEKIKAYVSFYKRSYRIVGITLLLMGTAFTPFLHFIIKDKINIPNISLIYLLFVLNSSIGYFFSYRFTIVIASQKGYILNVAGFFFNALSSMLQIAILIITKNYILVLFMQICINIVQNWCNSLIAIKLYPQLKSLKGAKLKKEELAKVFENVKALVIYKIGGTLVSSTDNVIISMFVGVISVGIYSNYLLIIGSVGTLLSIIFNSITASVGNLNSTDDEGKKYFIFNVINLLNFWMYGLCSIIMFVVATPFINLWIGKDFTMSAVIVFVVVINFYIDGMLNATWTYRETMGLFVHGKYRPIISATINLIFSVILVRKFGIIGVFIGTTITRITTNVWFDPYVVFKYGFNLPVRIYYFRYIKYFLLFMFTGALVSNIVNHIFVSNTLIDVIGMGVTSLIIPNIIFIAIFRKTKELKYLLNIFNKNINIFNKTN